MTLMVAAAVSPLSVCTRTRVSPALIPFTTPEDVTVATLSLSELHVNFAEATAGVKTTFNALVLPVITETYSGSTSIAVGATLLTRTSQKQGAAVIGSRVIVATPGAFAVILPLLFTVTISSLLEVHLGVVARKQR